MGRASDLAFQRADLLRVHELEGAEDNPAPILPLLPRKLPEHSRKPYRQLCRRTDGARQATGEPAACA